MATDPANEHSRPASGSVRYGDLPRRTVKTWTDIDVMESQDGRKIALMRAIPFRGIFFRITSPMEDGRESVLSFRISDDGAEAMAEMIHKKLSQNTELTDQHKPK
jgi:hypothetical protein